MRQRQKNAIVIVSVVQWQWLRLAWVGVYGGGVGGAVPRLEVCFLRLEVCSL